ncbi:hypothetical protein [Spiroplasma endosymbiont of Virgichneumon dumeticola]
MTANNTPLTDTTDVREYKSNDYNWWINNKNIRLFSLYVLFLNFIT